MSNSCGEGRKRCSAPRRWRVPILGLIVLGILPIAAAEADAQTIVIPGIGVFDIPDFLAPQGQVVQPPAAEKPPAEIAIEAARSKIGAGYSGGATGPDSFDCSGLVQWAYRQAGVDLPRTSYEQLATGTPVDLDDLEPGDLVSFYGGGHSALYAGNHQVVHASTYGRGVEVSDISEMPFAGARRF